MRHLLAVAFVLKTRRFLKLLPAWRQRERRQGNGMSCLFQLWLLSTDDFEKNLQKQSKNTLRRVTNGYLKREKMSLMKRQQTAVTALLVEA